MLFFYTCSRIYEREKSCTCIFIQSAAKLLKKKLNASRILFRMERKGKEGVFDQMMAQQHWRETWSRTLPLTNRSFPDEPIELKALCFKTYFLFAAWPFRTRSYEDELLLSFYFPIFLLTNLSTTKLATSTEHGPLWRRWGLILSSRPPAGPLFISLPLPSLYSLVLFIFLNLSHVSLIPTWNKC